ncbi:MAG TPA: DUF4012 domain-containing protein, partial [Actinomycetes bacterium]|nr:DUF4012 domain-containing protein [Actinomycetes bacterium]
MAAGLVLAWMAWLAVTLALASGEVRRGTAALETARSHAHPEELAAGRPLPDLQRAAVAFGGAHRALSGLQWAPARVLPVVGRQLRSLSALSSAAAGVAEASHGAIFEVQRLLAADRGGGPADRPALIEALAAEAARADARLASLQLGPREGLLPPLAHRRNQFSDELERLRAGLQRGAAGGRATADLLSGGGRYLVFAANNAEMRAGSGMLLSVGELEADGGVLRMGSMTTVENMLVPSGGAGLAGDLADRWGWLKPNEDWRNLMLSPRFDASAELAARMWVARGHRPVDGVIVVDPVVLQAVLAATGPIHVNGDTITAEDVVGRLLHDQYLRYPDDVQIATRREELGEVAQAAFGAVNGDRVSLPRLAAGLARAAGGRHLLVWSARPDHQAEWSAAGVDGGLRADSLLVSVMNRSGTKLDQFLDVSADLSYSREGGDTRATLRVRIQNRVPAGQPAYIAGPRAGSGVGRDVYRGIVSATLPGFARDARIDGVEFPAVAGADGPTRVTGVQLDVGPGQEQVLVIR